MVKYSLQSRLLAKVNIFQSILLVWAAFWHLFTHRFEAHWGNLNLSTASVVLLLLIAATFCRAKAPSSRPKAVALILGELFVLTLASATGAYGPTIMAFIVVAIKASILLETRDLLWVVPLTLVLRGLAGEGHDYIIHNMANEVKAVDIFALTPLWRKTRIPFLSALIMGTFLFRSLLTEQRSKERLEELSHEVRDLELKLERERIARDIHDSLGHSLTSLNIQLDVALHLLAQGKNGAGEAIKTAKVLSKQCLLDVRKTLSTIKQPDLDFPAAISELAEKTMSQGGVKVTLDIENKPLNQALSHHLFCITQECLTNALKHSCAKNILIKQSSSKDGLNLNIKDDGVGFDIAAPGDGNGVKGMKYRAESLGGTFCIISQRDLGTEIQIMVPALHLVPSLEESAL
jgi:signal transduction histidine kinase